MDLSLVKAIEIAEGIVAKIVSGGVTVWQMAAKTVTNLLPLATDTDRKSIFDGLGYMAGARLSSTGNVAMSSIQMCASGFIPAVAGDVVRIKGHFPVSGVTSYVITYNSSNTRLVSKSLQQKTDGSAWTTSGVTWYTYENGIMTIPLTSADFGTGFDSFRFSGAMSADTVVTVNQVINT